jgi:anthranilate phosphoribosyltransferase
MKETLALLLEHKRLSKEQAKEALLKIAKGEINAAQTTVFLSVFMMRSISVDELSGFREAMLELCIPVDLEAFDPIDLCGTGGDGKNTFNISTLSSFVVAGAGIPVAKHGNYGVSSAVGSSNIVEHLGYKFTNDKDKIVKMMETAGICFLHAPLFHPAMKNVAPIRKELGFKTFFNMLGPLVNPARPKKQILGVFSLELARLYGYLLQNTSGSFNVIHALDGYDEVSLTGSFKMISNVKEQLIDPQKFGFSLLTADQISGGDTIEESAKIFTNVLENKATDAQKNVVIINSALAIWTAKQELSIEEAIAQAKESLEASKALSVFKKLLSLV